MATCKACSAEIRWEPSKKSSGMTPISVATGESHFKDCPAASSFTKPKPKPSAAH